MSQAVAHMDEMTQQNAALAEQSAASAGSLTTQIQRLEELVGGFRTRGGRTARPAERSPPEPRYAPAPRAASTEPDRLRKLAEDAFTGRTASRVPAKAGPAAKAPARATATPRPAPRRAAGGA